MAFGTSGGGTTLDGDDSLTYDNGTDKTLQLLADTTHIAQFAVFDSTFTHRAQLRARTSEGSFVVADGLAMFEGVTPPTVTVLGGVAQFVTDSNKTPKFIDSAGLTTTLAPFPDITELLSTTNATVTSVSSTVAIADNTIYTIGVRIVGRKASSTDCAIYEATASFVRTGAGPRQLGTTAVGVNAKDDATWGTPAFTIVSNTVVMTVTGKAATSINWRVETWVANHATP